VNCGDCHKTTTGTTYGQIDTGSHTKHIAQVSIGLVNGCSDCHTGAADNGTVYNSTNHVDGSINVNAVVTYSAGGAPGNNYGTCSTTSCHGSGTPTWGGTVSCSDCHNGAGDVDDYTFNNATIARLDSTEWTTKGHGKTGAPLPLDCTYCHNEGVAHGTASNPFRLANNNVNGNGWNDACYVCHMTGSTGYNPGSGNKTSSVKIDKYHQMTAHSQSGNNGGKFCWDCHDPHGDDNIKMVQARPAKTTDGTYGIPSATPGNDVVFTDNTTGTGAGGFARTSGTFEEGICNTCHTASASNPKMQHYTSTSSDSHNSGQVCTTCHSHSGDTTVDGLAFEGSGDCISCHSNAQGTGGVRRKIVASGGDFDRATTTTKHVQVTVANIDQNTCQVCHDQSNHQSNTDPNILVFNQDTGASITYNGTGTSIEGFCVSCHDSDGSVQNGAQPFNDSGDTNSPVDIGWTTGSMAHSSASADACLGCHGDSGGAGTTTSPKMNAHASDSEYLLQYSNYSTGSSQTFCYNCHDGSVSSKDIQAAYGLTYNHSTGQEDCQDCHNQHAAESGLHTAGSTNMADMIGGVNLGVDVGGSDASYQYEICFQCHNAIITPKTTLTSENELDTTFSGGGVYASNWNSIPNIQSQFSTSNYAHHAVLGTGRNQPANSLNANWDSHAYRKDDTAPGGPFNGLDNNFVDGWVSTSLVTCSDCHDNSGSGVSGPHGSAQPWILKGMDKSTNVKITTAGAGTIYPNQSAPNDVNANANFCVNCHRADIYGWGTGGDTPTNNEIFARVQHLGGAATTSCTQETENQGNGGYANISCKNCHGGGEVAGIHGSNLGVGTAGSDEMGKRFINGNSKAGHTLGTTQVTCYTGTAPAIGVLMTSCDTKHDTGKTENTTYTYNWQ
jgi:hypothetical protein